MTISEMEERLQQKDKWKAELKELQRKKEALREEIRELEETKDSEFRDVEALEKRGLSNLLSKITGKMEEKRIKEEQEAVLAADACDAAAEKLKALNEKIFLIQHEIIELGDIERQIEGALIEKEKWIREYCPSKALEIDRKKEHAAFLRKQEQELGEAVSAGHSALHTVEQIIDELDSAKGWGTFDLIGGGLVSDLVKHSHLDRAGDLANQLKRELARFRTELADVTIDDQIHVQISGFLKFADFFWDGFFADFMVLDKITTSRDEFCGCRFQLSNAVDKLDRIAATVRRGIEAEENSIRCIIANAQEE